MNARLLFTNIWIFANPRKQNHSAIFVYQHCECRDAISEQVASGKAIWLYQIIRRPFWNQCLDIRIDDPSHLPQCNADSDQPFEVPGSRDFAVFNTIDMRRKLNATDLPFSVATNFQGNGSALVSPQAGLFLLLELKSAESVATLKTIQYRLFCHVNWASVETEIVRPALRGCAAGSNRRFFHHLFDFDDFFDGNIDPLCDNLLSVLPAQIHPLQNAHTAEQSACDRQSQDDPREIVSGWKRRVWVVFSAASVAHWTAFCPELLNAYLTIFNCRVFYYESVLTITDERDYDFATRWKSAGGEAVVTPLSPPNPRPSQAGPRAMHCIESSRFACGENLRAFPQPIRSIRPLLSVQPRPP